MVINNILDHIFTNAGNLAVLRVLNERASGISGRETARLAGIGLRSAQIALSNLEKFKIVIRQVGGRDHLFTLNRKNFLAKEVISKLFTVEKKFKISLYNEITDSINSAADSVILFGSVVRKEESVESDLDICIVYSKNKSRIEKIISKLRDELYDKYGVTLAPFYITGKDFSTKAGRNKSPVDQIIKEGKVLSGISIANLKNG